MVTLPHAKKANVCQISLRMEGLFLTERHKPKEMWMVKNSVFSNFDAVQRQNRKVLKSFKNMITPEKHHNKQIFPLYMSWRPNWKIVVVNSFWLKLFIQNPQKIGGPPFNFFCTSCIFRFTNSEPGIWDTLYNIIFCYILMLNAHDLLSEAIILTDCTKEIFILTQVIYLKFKIFYFDINEYGNSSICIALDDWNSITNKRASAR